MRIFSDFAGGNIIVDSIEESDILNSTTIRLRQDIRDSASWWFWWHFGIEDVKPSRQLVFVFTDGDVVSTYGPAVSYDGINYKIGGGATFISEQSFCFTFSEGIERVYFAFSLPYQVSHFERFRREYLDAHDDVVCDVLALSEQGREIPVVRIGHGGENVIFACRHHCCESPASYVLEGIMRMLTKSASLTDRFTFHIFPFADIDGVENGDQGKDRKPHDHNRDYTDEPIYNFTKAIYRYTADMEVKAYIDLHSPWKWGRIDDMTHIHLGPVPKGKRELQRLFCESLTGITCSSDNPNTILYDSKVFFSVYGGGLSNRIGTPSSKNYFGLKKNADMTIAIETPYFGNNIDPHSAENLHEFGENIVKALGMTVSDFI